MKATQFTEETWLPVVGYEGAYEVSSLGHVRTVPRIVCAGPGWRQIEQQAMRLFVGRGGYLQVTLQNKTHSVHGLVTAAFLGPRPDGMECCHNNGNAVDNRLSNLRYDTISANRLDTIKHGTNRQSAKTHCPRGHPYDEANTGRYGPGSGRTCRACARDRERAKRARKSA